MKDCQYAYRIYIGNNKKKPEQRLIEKYEEFVALGAKEITVNVEGTVMEGGNHTTYPYYPFERGMNYIIRPLREGNNSDGNSDGNSDDNSDGNSDGKEKESEEDKGIENGNEVEKDDKEEKEEKEKGIDKVQDIRDFYSKLSCGGGGGVESKEGNNNKNCVLCMCGGVE